MELERGGTLLLALLLGFFSILVSVKFGVAAAVVGRSFGLRAAELWGIKRKHGREQRAAVSASKAAKAPVHFCQTR